jgi:hypothetical protein
MEYETHQRLKEEKENRYRARGRIMICVIRNYLSALPHDSITPSVGDILLFGYFREILMNDNMNPKDVTSEMFMGELLKLPKFFEDWRKSLDRHLLALLRARNPNATQDDLGLATTAFICNEYKHHIVGYPQVLNHSHSRIQGCIPLGCPEDVQRVIYLGEWVSDVSRLSLVELPLIEPLVVAAGKDPATARTSELEELSPFVRFSSEDSSRSLFTKGWFAAVSH